MCDNQVVHFPLNCDESGRLVIPPHPLFTGHAMNILVVFALVYALIGDAITVNMCYIYFPNPSATDAALHAYFSVVSRRSHLDFKFTLLASNGNSQPSDMFRAIVTAPVDCDVYVGPRTSGYSIALGPIVTIPWVSDTASSVTLEDKTNFPWFSRMIASDAVGAKGIAAFLEFYNYTSANLICSEEVYGRSLKNGFEETYTGSIDTSVCISLAASREEIGATLRSIKATSSSRVVVMATSIAARASYWTNVVDEITSQGMEKTHIFVFPDAFCQSSTPYLDRLIGVICTTAAVNATAQNEYLARWMVYNQSNFDFILDSPSYDVNPPSSTLNQLSSQPRLSVDAVNFVMGAVEASYSQSGTSSESFDVKDRASILKAIRSFSTSGISGDIALDSKGNRVGSYLAFYNVQAGGNLVEFARWKDTAIKYPLEVEGVLVTWLGGTFISESAPSMFVAAGDLTSSDNYTQLLLTVVVVACVFILSVGVLSVALLYFSWTREMPLLVFLQTGAVFVTMGMITFHFVDIATDGVSCYVVVARNPSAAFSILYIVLTLFAFGASTLELALLLRYFFVVLGVSGDPIKRLAVSAKWEPRIARMSLVSAFVEDLPMVVMASVAVLDEANVFVMVSLMSSTILLGSKIAAVGVALSSILSRSSAENDMYEMVEEEVRKECEQFNFSRDMDMRDVDLPRLQI